LLGATVVQVALASTPASFAASTAASATDESALASTLPELVPLDPLLELEDAPLSSSSFEPSGVADGSFCPGGAGSVGSFVVAGSLGPRSALSPCAHARTLAPARKSVTRTVPSAFRPPRAKCNPMGSRF
jgi:hypothetical protein